MYSASRGRELLVSVLFSLGFSRFDSIVGPGAWRGISECFPSVSFQRIPDRA